MGSLWAEVDAGILKGGMVWFVMTRFGALEFLRG
jgi:hypothetical protein